MTTPGLSFKNANTLTSPWTHWFLYGPTGSGKTTAASTFPRPIFIVPQNEGSIATLRGRDFPYYEVVDMSSPLKAGRGGMVRVLDQLEAAYNKDPDEFPFDTIVIESLSHYADLCIEELTDGNVKPMDQYRWGRLTGHLRNLQKRLRQLEVHAVFTALETTDVLDNQVVIGKPMIQGQAAIKLPSACDVIGFMTASSGEKAKHTMHLRPYKSYAARSRFPLPSKIENFNFADVEHLLRVAEPDDNETTG